MEKQHFFAHGGWWDWFKATPTINTVWRIFSANNVCNKEGKIANKIMIDFDNNSGIRNSFQVYIYKLQGSTGRVKLKARKLAYVNVEQKCAINYFQLRKN